MVRLEKQMYYGAGVRLTDFMPHRRCGALEDGVERIWKMVPDAVTGAPRRQAVLKDSRTGREVFELPEKMVGGRPVSRAWHCVADCGSIGRPGMVWLFNKVGLSGTLRWDLPHRHICDLAEGEAHAGLTLCKLEWRSVLRLRVQPFGKGVGRDSPVGVM